MNDLTISRNLAAAAADLKELLPHLAERLAAMVDAQNGWPRSHSFDAGPGRAQITFCEEHAVDKCDCGGGTTYARNSDSVGEAAIRPDAAARDRKRAEELARKIAREASDLWRLLEHYKPHPPSEKDRRETLAANDRDISCWSCSRAQSSKGTPVWEPAARSVDVGGTRRQLCWWCLDWVRKGDGRLPTVGEVSRHHQGVRVSRPA